MDGWTDGQTDATRHIISLAPPALWHAQSLCLNDVFSDLVHACKILSPFIKSQWFERDSTDRRTYANTDGTVPNYLDN